MTAFTVWKFEDPQGAEHASSLLKDAAHDGLVRIMDHAVVSWPVGAERPTTKHGHDDIRHGCSRSRSSARPRARRAAPSPR